jgi:hypothetical protein
MRRIVWLLTMACIVSETLKHECGWLTKCRAMEVEGEVVFERRVKDGLEVTYRPYIHMDEDIIHGKIESVGTPAPVTAPTVPEASSDTGKSPD